jgi:hypothetical protein
MPSEGPVATELVLYTDAKRAVAALHSTDEVTISRSELGCRKR